MDPFQRVEIAQTPENPSRLVSEAFTKLLRKTLTEVRVAIDSDAQKGGRQSAGAKDFSRIKELARTDPKSPELSQFGDGKYHLFFNAVKSGLNVPYIRFNAGRFTDGAFPNDHRWGPDDRAVLKEQTLAQ